MATTISDALTDSIVSCLVAKARGKYPGLFHGYGHYTVNDNELLRYSRHILLNDIGIEGQQRILDAHVLIVGAGGLGSPAALYLAASGVGTLTVIDNDTVDLTNLQRQIAHTTARIGQPKVQSLAQAVTAINPLIAIHPIQQRADAVLLDTLLPTTTVVLDCCDNYGTRHIVNAACVRHRVPLVSGAAIGFNGQIGVFDTRQPEQPCYACMFDPDTESEEVQCSVMGVLAPMVGIIGSMQAAEALKLITHVGTSLTSCLLMLDGRSMQWRCMDTQRDHACAVCGPKLSR